MIGRRDRDGIVVVNHQNAIHAFFQKPPMVAHLLGRQFILLVVGVVHENKTVAMAVKILGSELFDVGRFERLPGSIGTIHDRSPQQIFHLAFVKRNALARFAEVHFDDRKRGAVDLHLQAFAEITRVICGHGYLFPASSKKSVRSISKSRFQPSALPGGCLHRVLHRFSPSHCPAVPLPPGKAGGFHALRDFAVLLTRFTVRLGKYGPVVSNGKVNILTNSAESVRTRLPHVAETSWQTELRQAVRDPHELCRLLELPPEWAERAVTAMKHFPLLVPRGFLRRIERANPRDPLLRQVLPLVDETVEAPDFVADPVGDTAATLQPGLLQKYAGRALLVTTGACAVHCRYCFRRHFPYSEVPHADAAWSRPLAALAADQTIHEVILSGGDPLMLVDARLASLVQRIAAISHVTRLRVHTRLPVMIPSRVTGELIQCLTQSRLKPIVVIHANHARELADDVALAIAKLQHAGVILLNQAVLLRGVNDTVEAQVALSERLLQLGVLPYYLHQLDRARGASHFEVPIETGLQIIQSLRTRLPGYAVPRYVQEVPGEPYKLPLG